MNKTLDKVFERADAAKAKWGAQTFVTLGLVAVEECGELAQAFLQAKHEGGSIERIREEAIDLAAVAAQLLDNFQWRGDDGSYLQFCWDESDSLFEKYPGTGFQGWSMRLSIYVGRLCEYLLKAKDGVNGDAVREKSMDIAMGCFCLLKCIERSKDKSS